MESFVILSLRRISVLFTENEMLRELSMTDGENVKQNKKTDSEENI